MQFMSATAMSGKKRCKYLFHNGVLMLVVKTKLKSLYWKRNVPATKEISINSSKFLTKP